MRRTMLVVLAAIALMPVAAKAAATTAEVNVTTDRMAVLATGVTLLPGCVLAADVSAPIGAGCPGSTGSPGADALPGCPAPGVDDRCEVVSDRFDGGGSDMTASDLGGSELIATTDDGRLVLTLGASDVDATAGRRSGLVVTAMDAHSGAHVWDARVATPADTWSSTIVTRGDHAYAVGYDLGIGACRAAVRVVAIDVDDASILWTRTLSPDRGSCVGGLDLAIADAARLVVSFDVFEPGGHQHGSVTGLAASDGASLWSHEMRPTGEVFNVGSSVSALGFDPNGDVLVAGSDMGVLGVGGSFAKHLAWHVDRLDAMTGARTMTARWYVPRGATSNAPANPPAALRTSTDGATIYLAGGVEHAIGASFDVTVLALDAVSGAVEWIGAYDGPRSASATNVVKKQASFDSVWFNGAMEVSSDGDILVAGYSSSEVIAPGLRYDFVTLRFSATDGRVEWSKRYGSETYLNWIPSLQLTADGETVVVNGQSRFDAMLYAARSTTIAYDAIDGEVRWIARHTEGHTFPQGLTLSKDGSRAFVAASSAAIDGSYTPQVSYPEYDILTVAYDI